jgi:hypothetical protein
VKFFRTVKFFFKDDKALGYFDSDITGCASLLKVMLTEPSEGHAHGAF